MNKKGFSLMEIMIVVVIVGILAAVAIPAYTGHVTRTRRGEAVLALAAVALQEEKNFAERNSYDTLANLIARGFRDPNADADRNYNIQVIPAAAGWQAGFVASATGMNALAGDGIVFAIDNNGNRGTLNAGVVAVNNQMWNNLRQ
jgi:type IV pilus assembly protein PilE